MSKTTHLLFALIPFLLTLSCSSVKNKQAAEGAVARFHSQLNAEQYHDIYSQASPEFQKSAREAEISAFLAAVHHKLGNTRKTKEDGFYVNFSASGTTVTLSYETDFDGGPATEQFVWRIAGQPLLVHYQINSPALAIK